MRPAAWIGPGLLALAPTAAAAQGLTTTFFDGASCAPLPDAVRASRLQSTLELADATAWDLPPGTLVPYTIRMSGMFRADTDGPHTFQLEADDTVVVTIDGSEIYSVPGPRGVTTTTFGVALSAGDHVLEICHVEEGGPRTFNLRLQAPGSASFVPIASRQLVYDPPFGPGSTTIGFDTLAAGTYLTTELVASDGVRFLEQLGPQGFYYSRPRVVAAANGTTPSPPNVLRNESYDAIEATQISANVPLRIRFSSPQSHISVSTGTQDVVGVRPAATLRAFDASGALVAAHRIDQISPSVIHRLHVVRGATDISLVSLDHGDIANDERIDGFQFEAYRIDTPPVDTEPPTIDVLEPNSSTVRSPGLVRILVRVRENSGSLARVQAFAEGASADMEVDGTIDGACVPPICARYSGALPLSNGRHTLRIEAEDDAGNIGSEELTIDFTGVTEIEIVDEAGTTVADAELYVDGRRQPYVPEADGSIRIYPPLRVGTQLAARQRLFESGTYREAHAVGSTQDWNFRVYLTSVEIDDTGAALVDVVSDPPTRRRLVIRRSNVLFGLHVTAATEWDATTVELEDVRDKIQFASDFLYNATDGQFVIEQAEIWNGAHNWGNVDYRVFAREIRANVSSHVGGFLGPNVVHTSMNLWRSNEGHVWAHEAGHFVLDVRDEYKDDDPNARCTGGVEQGTGDAFDSGGAQASCMMWHQWSASKLCSNHPSNPHVGGLRQGTACWDQIVARYGNAAFNLKTPTTRGAIPASLTPPVAAWRQTSFRLEARSRTIRRCGIFRARFLDGAGRPYVGGNVWLQSGHSALMLDRTDAMGEVQVIGASPGDLLRLDAASAPETYPPRWDPDNPPWLPRSTTAVTFEAEIPITEANCP